MKRRRFGFYTFCWCVAIGSLLMSASAGALFGEPAPSSLGSLRGLPFTRTYPLEEVGNVPRGARMSFDRFGRLAVVYDGIYAVLNDTTWLDIADKSGDGLPFVIQDGTNRAYYCGFGAWG